MEEVEDILSEHKELAKVRSEPLSLSLSLSARAADAHKRQHQGEKQKKASKKTGSGLTQEELLKVQEELFAKSKAKMEGGGAP